MSLDEARSTNTVETRARDGFRLLGKHRSDCWGAEAGGFYCADGVEWRDKAGRKQKAGLGGYHQWLRLKCNCTGCPAVAVVRLDLIAEMANRTLPTRPKGAPEAVSRGDA